MGTYDKPITGRRVHFNPYESLYPDNHEARLAVLSAMKSCMCIKDLVLYIISESQHVMSGTVHEKYWGLYHNTLSLMIDTSKMKWITETMIDEVSVKYRWLVPQNGVNAGTVYVSWPVGNSPEFMPWDNSLKADVKRSHDYYCVVTNKLGDKDTCKL